MVSTKEKRRISPLTVREKIRLRAHPEDWLSIIFISLDEQVVLCPMSIPPPQSSPPTPPPSPRSIGLSRQSHRRSDSRRRSKQPPPSPLILCRAYTLKEYLSRSRAFTLLRIPIAQLEQYHLFNPNLALYERQLKKGVPPTL